MIIIDRIFYLYVQCPARLLLILLILFFIEDIQTDVLFHLNHGPTCKKNYDPVTSNLQACKEAVESLGHSEEHMAYYKGKWMTDGYTLRAHESSRPQGCYQENRTNTFKFNREVTDKSKSDESEGNILCRKRNTGKQNEVSISEI